MATCSRTLAALNRAVIASRYRRRSCPFTQIRVHKKVVSPLGTQTHDDLLSVSDGLLTHQNHARVIGGMDVDYPGMAFMDQPSSSFTDSVLGCSTVVRTSVC